MSSVLRPATLDDVELLVEMNAEYALAEGHEPDPQLARQGIEPLIRDGTYGQIHLVLDEVGTPIGYAVLAWSWSIEIGGPEAVLDELYVRQRNHGYGGRALEAVMEICAQQGMRRVFMETERANEGARRLYRRHGFSDDDSIWLSRLTGR
jgi:GNAT superfamily N-acetyltransferase